jgi:hypothetical protein
MYVVEALMGAVGLGIPVYRVPAGPLAEVLMREAVAVRARTHCSLGFQAPFSRNLLLDCLEVKLLVYALWECMVIHRSR